MSAGALNDVLHLPFASPASVARRQTAVRGAERQCGAEAERPRRHRGHRRADERITARFAAGTDPEQFAVSPDGRCLYSSNEDAGTASITETTSGRILATLIMGIEPAGVAVSPDGRWVYVTAGPDSARVRDIAEES